MIPGLRQLQIELTNACNAKCVICPNRISQRSITHMDLGLLDKVIEEVKLHGIASPKNAMGVCGLGEPLLHPKIFEVLDRLSLVDYGIGSNGFLMNEEMIDALIKSRFRTFTLSLDGFTEKGYSSIRVGLPFNVVQENALLFARKLKECERFWDIIWWQFVVTNANKQDIPAYIDFWGKELQGLEGVRIAMKSLCPWPTSLEKANQLYPGPNDIQVFDHPLVTWGNYADPVRFKAQCDLVFRGAQVMSDGTFTFCCMNTEDVFHVGNLHTKTIEECFNSPQMGEYRRLVESGRVDQVPFCNGCY